MPPLPEIPLATPQLRTPQSPVSPADIAQPYNDLARTLDKAGEVLMQDVAKPAAHQAGLQAVTRDADGNVQVQRVPIFGDASPEFMRAVKFSAVSDGEGALKRADIAMRQKFRDDPEGYQIAAEKFKTDTVNQYTKIAGADVGLTLGKIIDGQTTLTYRGLLTEHERLTLQRADKSIENQIQSARDDLVAMARGGVSSGPAWDASRDKITTLTNERTANPRLAYPKEQADYDMQHLDGELKANGFLYHVDQVYKNPDPDKGGAQAALTEARSILTDPSIKLTEQQREAYFHKAVGEVRANEAIRKQDLNEARASAADIRTASALGLRIEPEMVDKVAKTFYDLKDPGSAARLYAWAGRAPLNDDFGRQPLREQTRQLQDLRVAPQATQAFQFFTNKGYTPAQASGIVGNLIQESNLNPNAVHDGGIGLGISGWNKERLTALKGFAAARGTSANDFTTQLEFVDHELNSSEGATGARLRGAKTPEEAGAAMISYFRPAGWTPSNPERGDGFGNRVSNARTVFAGAGGEGMAPNPSASLWLTANRTTAVQKEARAGWKEVIKEWNASGITPNTDAVMTVVNAARTTGDHTLLDQIGTDMERVQIVQEAAQGPLAGQHAALAELRRQAASGEIQPGNALVLKQLQAKNDAIEKGIAENPISTATANFPEKLRAPAPLNVADQAAFRGGLAQRAQIAQFAAQNWQTPALPALDKADVQGIQATLQGADPATRARIFSDLTAAIPDEKIRNATFGKLAEGGPKAATQAYAGALYGQAPDIAASILRGQHAMEVDERNNPAKEGEGKERFNTEVDKALPQGAFSLAGRTDPSGPYAVMRNAAIARYADLTAQDPNSKKEFSTPRLQQAVNDVTGGILDHNGGKFIAPMRGMPQATFDRVLWGVTDQDLAGVTTLAGEPVTRDYLRGRAQLESYGDGRYLVRLGSDPSRPIYAVQNANTEMPQPFVLDLRGRKPSDQGPARSIEFAPYPRGIGEQSAPYGALASIPINTPNWDRMIEQTAPSKNIEDRRDMDEERYQELWQRAFATGKGDKKGARDLTPDEREWLLSYARKSRGG